jgi:hypothetical protein
VVKVSALRALVAKETTLPLERLKLIFKGKTLLDHDKAEAVFINLVDGGVCFLLMMVLLEIDYSTISVNMSSFFSLD